ISAMNMLIGILIGCSIVSIMLIIIVAPNQSVPTHEEIPQQSRS
ncbi:multidrug transporter subunit MdtL, partial [Salmonella enterica subsp. enterica serovar Braenderup]